MSALSGLFGDIYKNKKILITGHTGFKGNWLSAWLYKLGANVVGLSLPPSTNPNHFDLLNLPIETHFCDIREGEKVKKLIESIAPEIVFHLAAQPLVLTSYEDPIGTYETNIMGTLHVLEGCRKTKSVQAILNITSDKCYENKEWIYPYREVDPMGGHDPYSSSKGCSELITSSYRKSFFHSTSVKLASARAGNVIGGGDWAPYRIIPDIIRSWQEKKVLSIRSPKSTRPWQHVLTPLYGYLLLGEQLLKSHQHSSQFSYDQGWNFGPYLEANVSVEELAQLILKSFPDLQIEWGSVSAHHEATLLNLDSSMATKFLGFSPVWNFKTTVEKTTEWYKAYFDKKDILTFKQIEEFSQNICLNLK